MICCVLSFKVWDIVIHIKPASLMIYSKFIRRVLKTATAIVIPSKYNSTRLHYFCINFDNLYFKNGGRSVGIDVQLFFLKIFFGLKKNSWCIFIGKVQYK